MLIICTWFIETLRYRIGRDRMFDKKHREGEERESQTELGGALLFDGFEIS
jgi:hypothetical protein